MKSLILLCSALLLTTPVHAAQLTLELGADSRTWQTDELLKHPLARTVTVKDDVSYKRDMSYRAVPISALLTGVKADDHLQAVALDGFAAELPAAPLLNQDGAQAWLAIEDPAKPWPPLAEGKHSAGPFYLVWTNPQAGHISPEQWPFEVASIKRLAPVTERFPALRPDPKLAAGDPVNQGFALFQKNCLACHRLNGAGDSQFGPDLNIPYSPTEYFGADFLKRYIRDPQSLRRWPQAKMPAFASSVLPDAELELLVGYLKHMAGRKQAAQ
ncbi:c-type cytochrome [Pseudomonas chlororaphis]|uniref:c-type cytochrome n=1 Tax=Pseudomonas chlororaphis TaxID=587753 RepID=UPI0007B356BE|nr:cytochrome c [Pseudomonas chlororaphis]AZC49468.1 Cytochrome c family protein [Pseudomonas chlororaphis subsp. piscium]AZC56095.1 Cytochrome c family protein [Pseudomonas chlororaphis subsp. piscium]AZC62353.1 Cytochrome c family protein [Pseudomonas chlororaphis subsp. piscium]AZC68591.1 Cytochrome c family protein [Pseudomonas chlororaphis subsp. piscium]AZC74781.1 Cytochrome c family protein [Pseudomonas chlororaphis subsp. piscium]